jgi:hypothetical protein
LVISFLYLVQFRVLGKLFGLWIFRFFFYIGTVLGFDKYFWVCGYCILVMCIFFTMMGACIKCLGRFYSDGGMYKMFGVFL